MTVETSLMRNTKVNESIVDLLIFGQNWHNSPPSLPLLSQSWYLPPPTGPPSSVIVGIPQGFSHGISCLIFIELNDVETIIN